MRLPKQRLYNFSGLLVFSVNVNKLYFCTWHAFWTALAGTFLYLLKSTFEVICFGLFLCILLTIFGEPFGAASIMCSPDHLRKSPFLRWHRHLNRQG